MYRIEPKETNHDFEKQNLVTKRGTKGGYDVMKCKHCGMTGRRYNLVQIEISGNYSKDNVFECKKAPKKQNSKTIKIIQKPTIFNLAFNDCTVGSIHEIIETPKGEKEDWRGVWIQGIGEPIKILNYEFEYL